MAKSTTSQNGQSPAPRTPQSKSNPAKLPKSQPSATKDGDSAPASGTKASSQQPTAAKRIRFAVVGLGHIAQAAMLPAFAHAKRHAELAALVTDDDTKLRELGERYKVTALANYDNFRRILRQESIDAVYIATPNSEHVDLVLDAAAAGVHVLCEKPLGVTERECLDMIDACDNAGVYLMTAYRLHFEAANLSALKAIHTGQIGDPRVFTSVFSYQVKDPNIRLQRDLSGGPLQDIGIYCINAARSVFRAEPVQVHAWRHGVQGDPRFDEVEETVSVQLRFPDDQLATFTCSFGTAATSWYQVVGTKGDVCVDPAYDYAEGLATQITIDDKTRSRQFAKRDQFAAELVYFSKCIQEGREPEPSGWEGYADVRVIRALMQSMERGRPLDLPPSVHVRRPSPSQRIDRPPVTREPKLVHAESASD